MAKPETLLARYRKLVAQKFDGSKRRGSLGRPRLERAIEELVVKLALENCGWGYDRFIGAMANLGHGISAQSVGNILRHHGTPPAPERKKTTTLKEFIRAHMNVLAGTDFLTAEVLTWHGLVTYYVLFFIHLAWTAVACRSPGSQIILNRIGWSSWRAAPTLEGWGFLQSRRYLLHDRDAKFSESFRDTLAAGGVKPLKLPARSPNLNAFAERWARSVKEECLATLVLIGETSLRRALTECIAHFHAERNHQGKGNALLFPSADRASGNGSGRVRCQQRLGGLLRYYHPEAA